MIRRAAASVALPSAPLSSGWPRGRRDHDRRRDRRAQARWLRELLLPDPQWMRGREGAGWLPWLYLRRAARGWRVRA